jgi:hypothetical protein
VATWDDVLRVALALPETEESTSYRQPCVKVRGKTFVTLGGRDPGTIVLRCPEDEAHLLIAALPEAYFVTPHYAGWDGVLARLAAIGGDELAARIEDAYAFMSARTKPKGRA